MSCIHPTAAFYAETKGIRLYKVGDKLLPSASSIADGVLAKDGLRAWAIREAIEHVVATLGRYVGRRLPPEALALAKEEALRRPDRLAHKAAAIGQGVHGALEAWLKEGGAVPPGLQPVADWLQRWRRMGFRWHPELALGSVAAGAAGCIDLLGVNGGEAVIADLKTSAAVRDSHLLQIAIYSLIVAEAHGLAVRQAFVLLLPRTGEPLRVVEVDLPRWRKAATHAIGLFWALWGELWETAEVPEPPPPRVNWSWAATMRRRASDQCYANASGAECRYIPHGRPGLTGARASAGALPTAEGDSSSPSRWS